MPRRYKWDEWFAHRSFQLVSGVHYDCTQAAMCQQVRDAACIRRVGVRVVNKGDSVFVEVHKLRGRRGTKI